MKSLVLIGTLLGAIVVLDPLLMPYLRSNLPLHGYPIHDLPYLLSISVALLLFATYLTRATAPGLGTRVILDYYRAFPFVFLLAYQMNGLQAGPLDSTEIVIAAFLFLFAFGLFINKERYFVSTPLNVLYGLLAICILLSLPNQFQILAFLKSPKPFIVLFLLLNFLSWGNLTHAFLRWMVILAITSSCFCLFQEYVWVSSMELLSLAPEEDLERMFETTPLGPVFRVPGLMIGYRPMALYLATSLMLVVGALLWRREQQLMPRKWLLFGALVISLALILTMAKDVLIGTCLGALLLLVMQRPRQRLLFLALAGAMTVTAGLIAIALIPGNVDTAIDLTRTVPKSEIERIRLDRDSIEGAAHGPYLWTGRGVGAGKRYTGHPLGWPAHNAFILVTAELGLIGLAVYLMIHGLIISRIIMLNLKIRAGPDLPIVRGFSAVMVVVLIGAQFEASYQDIFVCTIFAVIEALWYQTRRQDLATVATAS